MSSTDSNVHSLVLSHPLSFVHIWVCVLWKEWIQTIISLLRGEPTACSKFWQGRFGQKLLKASWFKKLATDDLGTVTFSPIYILSCFKDKRMPEKENNIGGRDAIDFKYPVICWKINLVKAAASQKLFSGIAHCSIFQKTEQASRGLASLNLVLTNEEEFA